MRDHTYTAPDQSNAIYRIGDHTYTALDQSNAFYYMRDHPPTNQAKCVLMPSAL